MPADTRSLNGSAGDLVGGTGSITGMYGSEAIAPIMAAYWVGQPNDPTESAGGPFVNLFSTAVTCNDISVTGWLSKIPATTQVLELIIGTKTVGTASPAASAAAANVAEVNYLFARPSDEIRAGAGSVTLTAYASNVSVAGTVSVTFPSGSADGTFDAVYCPGGQEESR
ncbi:hypothetical protein BH11MYX1_BH11MYX1_39460 [soil metagenome]